MAGLEASYDALTAKGDGYGAFEGGVYGASEGGAFDVPKGGAFDALADDAEENFWGGAISVEAISADADTSPLQTPALQPPALQTPALEASGALKFTADLPTLVEESTRGAQWEIACEGAPNSRGGTPGVGTPGGTPSSQRAQTAPWSEPAAEWASPEAFRGFGGGHVRDSAHSMVQWVDVGAERGSEHTDGGGRGGEGGGGSKREWP